VQGCSGWAVTTVSLSSAWPGIGLGRTREPRKLARSGILEIAYVPTLDHSFHVARGRAAALNVPEEWVLGTGPGRSTLAPDAKPSAEPGRPDQTPHLDPRIRCLVRPCP
jgi:hypothetical protein